jgi:xanthosine utilization system XapX-like protein
MLTIYSIVEELTIDIGAILYDLFIQLLAGALQLAGWFGVRSVEKIGNAAEFMCTGMLYLLGHIPTPWNLVAVAVFGMFCCLVGVSIMSYLDQIKDILQ